MVFPPPWMKPWSPRSLWCSRKSNLITNSRVIIKTVQSLPKWGNVVCLEDIRVVALGCEQLPLSVACIPLHPSPTPISAAFRSGGSGKGLSKVAMRWTSQADSCNLALELTSSHITSNRPEEHETVFYLNIPKSPKCILGNSMVHLIGFFQEQYPGCWGRKVVWSKKSHICTMKRMPWNLGSWNSGFGSLGFLLVTSPIESSCQQVW